MQVDTVPSGSTLPDHAASLETRGVPIERVGIKGLRYPIQVLDQSNRLQSTVANVNLSVALPADVKGTHMSRFVEILNEQECLFTAQSFVDLVSRVAERLESGSAHISVEFPFFRKKSAPSSGVKSFMDYQVTLSGTLSEGKTVVSMKVVVPVTSLCPCSKSISKYGAHNQRSHITIEARASKGAELALEDLIDLAEQKASCELYAILKREDEKIVTERAYDNPAFVEDLVRDIAVELNNNDKINYYCLESENFESIHNHSAYALIKNQK